jgi:predicted nucleic acid-binding protein
VPRYAPDGTGTRRERVGPRRQRRGHRTDRTGSGAADLLASAGAVFQTPSIFDVEVISALRELVRGGKYGRTAASELIADLIILPVGRWHISSLLPRIWDLRENLTPYDAAYVALGEMTAATLLTGDERITAAPTTRCEIRVIT